MRVLITAATAVIATMVMAGTTMAQSDREPITDPATLVSLGYAPDAKNIFRLTAGADRTDLAQLRNGSQPANPSFDPFPEGVLQHTTATGFAFFPLTHTNEYVKGPSFLVMNGGLVSITAGGVYEVQWNLPHGSVLLALDTFGYHNEATRSLTVTVIERCLDFLSVGNPVETVLVSRDIAATGGNFLDLVGIPRHFVDARRCSYHTRARFSQADAPSPGLNMQLTKVRLFGLSDRIFVDGFELPEEVPISGH